MIKNLAGLSSPDEVIKQTLNGRDVEVRLVFWWTNFGRFAFVFGGIRWVRL